MNKDQFLLELRQYLTFLTAEERGQVLDEYTEKFDAVGETGEAALIPQLGTPMMIAIALKRRKEAGEPLTDRPPTPKAAVPAPESEEPQAAEKPEETAAAEPALDETILEEPEAQLEDTAQEPLNEPASAPAKPEKRRVTAGAVISCVLLSLLSAVLALAIVAVGAYCFIVFGNLLVVGFQSLNTVMDALLLFAGALIAGGIGVVIAWLGIWTGIRLIAKQIARLRA